MTVLPVQGTLDSDEPLPTQVDHVNSSWFSQILGENVKVVNKNIIWGTATKILVDLIAEDSEDETSLTKVCVKGGFDPELIALGLDAVYRREAEFFYYIAPEVRMRLPKSLFAGTNPNGQGIIVLENLAALGCKFGECEEAWPIERAKVALVDLAALHGRTWGKKIADFSFLGKSSDEGFQTIIGKILSPEAWNQRFFVDPSPPVPESLMDRERIFAAFQKLWRTRNLEFQCIVHGDPHVGNTFVTSDGMPGFLDWQAVHISSPMHDVAYFLAGALEIQDRRDYERELLEHYLNSLNAAGGPKLSIDDIWHEYQMNHLHGFVWPVSTPAMQVQEKVDAMSLRHCAAILDHKSIELIEALSEGIKI